jgi:hypothetical protein
MLSSVDPSNYAEKLIKSLGIGAKRLDTAPPQVLFSTDFSREKIRQEIRKKVEESLSLIEKRVGDVVSLDGRSVIIKQEKSLETMLFDFETACSGVDSEGKVFVSTSDSKVPDGATLFFMSAKAGSWAIEPITSPNLANSYFTKLGEEEERLAETERLSLEKK